MLLPRHDWTQRGYQHKLNHREDYMVKCRIACRALLLISLSSVSLISVRAQSYPTPYPPIPVSREWADSMNSRLDAFRSTAQGRGYSKSVEFLDMWRGRSSQTGTWKGDSNRHRVLSMAELNSDNVRSALMRTRELIVNSVWRDLNKTMFARNSYSSRTVRTYAWSTPDDWAFSVGGFKITTDYALNLSAPDENGNILVTFSKWRSVIDDVYDFEKEDYYDILGTGVPFSRGELNEFEQFGLSHAFSISSVPFSSAGSTESFVVSLSKAGQNGRVDTRVNISRFSPSNPLPADPATNRVPEIGPKITPTISSTFPTPDRTSFAISAQE